jgi:hypothetical protein
MVFDQTKLRHEVQANSHRLAIVGNTALASLNLIKDCKFFDHNIIKPEDANNLLRDADTIKKEFLESIETKLKALFDDKANLD